MTTPNLMVVFTLMGKHKISREEAEKRIDLLAKSSIVKDGHTEDPFTQRLIDEFLARDSSESEVLVAFDICLNECYQNKELVANYDRLKGAKTDMRGVLDGTITDPKRIQKEIEKFGMFVKEYVFDRLPRE